MGIGPAFAIPKALEKAGITKDDVDFFEINEVGRGVVITTKIFKY